MLWILMLFVFSASVSCLTDIPKDINITNYGFQGNKKASTTWFFRSRPCNNFQLYDYFSKKCRRVYCRQPRGNMSHRKCTIHEAFEGFLKHDEFIDIEAEEWGINLIVIFEGNLTNSHETLKELEVQMSQTLKISSGRISVEYFERITDNYGWFEVNLMEDIGETVTNDQIKRNFHTWASHSKSFIINQSTVYIVKADLFQIGYHERSFCDSSFEKILYQWELNFTVNEKHQLINNENGRVYQKGEYIASVLTYESDSNKTISFVALCEKITGLYCDVTRLPVGSYEFLNGGTYVKSAHGITDKFEMDVNSTVNICQQASFFCVVNQTENTIVGICLIISSIFLILILVTFMMIPNVTKTLPGFNTINLVLTILILQILFLTGPRWTNCWLSGIFLNYFILLNFSWSSIIGFYIFRTFVTHGTVNNHKHKNGNRLTSFAMAHLMVAIVIGISLINEYAANDFAPSFGPYQGVCWMRNSIGVLFYFAAPVSLSNSFNIIFYLASYITIRRTLNESVVVSIYSRPTSRSMPPQFSVFSRIATALSISWLIILVIPVTSPKSITYQLAKFLFVFINTNQGLLLFIAFIWNKKVGLIWLNRLGAGFKIAKKAQKKSSLTVSSSTQNILES